MNSLNNVLLKPLGSSNSGLLLVNFNSSFQITSLSGSLSISPVYTYINQFRDIQSTSNFGLNTPEVLNDWESNVMTITPTTYNYCSYTIKNIDNDILSSGFFAVNGGMVPGYAFTLSFADDTSYRSHLSAKQDGYAVGYDDGYDYGYQDGEIAGYNFGYNLGIDTALTDAGTFSDLIFDIVDAPVQVITNSLDFEILGVNFSTIAIGILSIGVVLAILGLFRK